MSYLLGVVTTLLAMLIVTGTFIYRNTDKYSEKRAKSLQQERERISIDKIKIYKCNERQKK